MTNVNSKTLIVIKHSKYEWEMLQTGISHDDLVNKYKQEQANVDAILGGHEKQLEARNHMLTAFGSADFCFMNEIPANINEYALVIVLGGDNSFTNVSHYISSTNIIGANSDPKRSSGYLMSWQINELSNAIELKERIDFGEYETEEWPRLGATLNGQPIALATSEYYIGEYARDKMSRHVIEFGEKKEEQKCSGIIVSTGAGSTGWYGSLFSFNRSWRADDRIAKFVATECFQSNILNCGEIKDKDVLKLYSLNDDHGVISADSWTYYNFNRGSAAEIYLSTPLKVIKINCGIK